MDLIDEVHEFEVAFAEGVESAHGIPVATLAPILVAYRADLMVAILTGMIEAPGDDVEQRSDKFDAAPTEDGGIEITLPTK